MEKISHQGMDLMTCSGKGTSIFEPNSTLSRILYNGNQTAEALLIRHQHFKYFPLNLSILMRNLTAIQLIGCGLRELNARDLTNFTELTSLWLPRNEIQILRNGTFDSNLKLRKLSFFGNQLKVIESNILTMLKNLIFVSFERNLCINMTAEEDFDDLKNEIAINCEEI